MVPLLSKVLVSAKLSITLTLWIDPVHRWSHWLLPMLVTTLEDQVE